MREEFIVEMPFIPGVLISLVIFIAITRIYMIISNYTGEQVRTFFVNLWEMFRDGLF